MKWTAFQKPQQLKDNWALRDIFLQYSGENCCKYAKLNYHRLFLSEFIHVCTLTGVHDLQCTSTTYLCCLHILLLRFSSCSTVRDPKLLCWWLHSLDRGWYKKHLCYPLWGASIGSEYVGLRVHCKWTALRWRRSCGKVRREQLRQERAGRMLRGRGGERKKPLGGKSK